MNENKVMYLKPGETKCPRCGSTHIVEISRITGYLAMTERWGSGKTKERKRRVDHNNKHEKIY